MREFLTGSVAPFLGVCCLIWGLTVVLFDVPRGPLPVSQVVASKVAAAPTPVRTREQMNDVLARAMRQLDLARTPPPAERSLPPGRAVSPNTPTRAAVAPGLVEGPGVATPAIAKGLPEDPALAKAATDPGLIQTISALGEAVKAVHAVRTEEDIVRAEESIRTAREQMEEACKAGASGGPLCEGASQMRSLGY